MNAQQLWRIVRTPVILLALVALVVLGAIWGWREVVKPPPGALPDACVAQPIEGGKLFSEQVTVEVHNAGSQRGLAGQVASDLESQGFIVADVGNAEDLRAQNVAIIGAAVDAPEVRLVADQFPDAELRAEPDDLADHRVLVVLGDDFSGMKGDAARSIDVDTDTACLPALPSADADTAGD